MSRTPNTLNDPLPRPVPHVDTGHPLRDWVAWKIANTPEGQPTFPLLRQLVEQLLAFLLKQL